MSQTRYSVEIQLFAEPDRWRYVAQTRTMAKAILVAERAHYRRNGQSRVLKVVKTIVWESEER